MRAPQTAQRRGTAASAVSKQEYVSKCDDGEGVVDVGDGNVLGRSAWEAIWITRAAPLAELEELKRTERAETLVMGRRARTANILILVL